MPVRKLEYLLVQSEGLWVKYEREERMNLRKVFPFIPVIGLFLTWTYHTKYGDTGIENIFIAVISGFLQSIYIAFVALLITGVI